jgi:hypothetical protein
MGKKLKDIFYCKKKLIIFLKKIIRLSLPPLLLIIGDTGIYKDWKSEERINSLL